MKTGSNRHRRGLSSVVGAVFMVLVMIGALNVILLALNQQSNVTQAVIDQTNKKLNNLNEKISVSKVTIVNNKFNITVANDGSNNAHLVSLYVINETASPKTEYRYSIDYNIVGRNSTTNIGQSLVPTLIAKDKTDYTIKIVSEAGNTALGKVSRLSSLSLGVSLIAIPPTIPPGANATLLLSVTNNSTFFLANPIRANMTYACSGTCTIGAPKSTSGNNTMLNPGQTIFFKWVYNIIGPDNSYVTFTSKLVDGKVGNTATERIQIKLLQASNVTFAQYTSIVGNALIQKPEIFPLYPGPFGDSAQAGLFGAIIANPVSATMKISRVMFTLQSPDFQGNQFQIVTTSCTPTAIGQTSTLDWSCPSAGVIQWANTANPIVLAPNSAYSFMVKVLPGGVTTDELAIISSITVFSDFGQFAKTGYSTSMSATVDSLGQVYFTDTNNTALTALNTHIFGNFSNFKSGQAKWLNVTLADLDTINTTWIKAGTKLIVNVPPGFNVLGASDVAKNGFNANPTRTTFADGSQQVVATLTADLGKTAGLADGKILNIKLTPATVTTNTVYIFHCLSYGTTQVGNSIDGFGELSVIVKP